MKLIIFAGPPTCGKTTVIKQVIRRILKKDLKPAYLKVDVLYADEDEVLKKEFNIDEKILYAYIGPGISQKNFQVGNDVAELFDEGVKIFKGKLR